MADTHKKNTFFISFLTSTGGIFLFCSLLFFIFNSSFLTTLAAPDLEMTYHGKLTDTSNVAVADGNYDFTITIYDAATNGSCLWTARGTCGTPTAKSLTVTNGIFSTTLGESGDNALDLDFSANYWLDIKISTNPSMTPRRKITPTGFALNSHRFNGLTADNYLDTSATTQTKAGALTINNILTVNDNLTVNSGNVGFSNTTSQVLTRTAESGYVRTTTYSSNDTNWQGGYDIAMRSGNTNASPTSVLNGWTLARYSGRGYKDSEYSILDNAYLSLVAEGDFSDTSTPAAFTVGTTPSGSTTPVERFRINNAGRVGIGTTSPTEELNIAATDDFPVVRLEGFSATSHTSHVIGSAARGSQSLPSATQDTDTLFVLRAQGYGATGYVATNTGSAQIVMSAEENFTDATAAGRISFHTTPTGSTTAVERMTILGSGYVGIGDATPSYELDVDGSGRFMDSLGVGTTTSGTYQFAARAIKAGVSGSVDYQRAIFATVDPDSTLWTQTSHNATGIMSSVLTDGSITGSDTLDSLQGITVQHGAYDGTAGTITNSFGLRIVPYRRAGTIDNQYDLYISTPSIGGTLTNTHYSIYQEDSNTTNYFGGNIGIGTTNPNELLQVNGAINIGTTTNTNAGTIRWNGSDFQGYTGSAWASLTASGASSIWDADTDTGIQVEESADEDIIRFDTAGTERMTIDSSGNLIPSAVETYNLGSSSYRWQDLYLGPESLHIGSSTTDEGIISYNTTSNIFGIATDSTTQGDIAFNTNDLYIDTSASRVGIGTTSPVALLDIATNDISTTPATAADELLLESSGDTGLSIFAGTNSNASIYFGEQSVGTGRGRIIYDTNTDDLTFYTTGSQRITIDSDGDVGIGTESPNATLDVAGSVLARGGSYTARPGTGSDSSSNAALVIDRGDGILFEYNGYLRNLIDVDNSSNIDIGQYGTTLVSSINLMTGSGGYATIGSGGTETVRVTGGNVGIGTAIPDSDLHVYGASPVIYLQSSGDTNTGLIRLLDSGGNNAGQLAAYDMDGAGADSRWVFQNTIGDIQFGNTGDVHFVNTGSVGIGNTSPNAMLHIGDSSNSLGTTAGDNLDMLTLHSDTVNADYLEFSTERISSGSDWTTAAHRIQRRVDSTDMGYMQFGHYGDDLITFGEGSTEYMVIDGGGDVGIGETNPGAKLHVDNIGDTVANVNDYGMIIDHDMSGSDALTADRTHTGLYVDVDSSATGGDINNEHRVYGLQSNVQVTGDSDLVYASHNTARTAHSSGTVSSVVGSYGLSQGDNSAGTTSNVMGVQGLAYEENAGTRTGVFGTYGKTLKQATATTATNIHTGSYGEIETDNGAAAITTGYAFRAIIDNDNTGLGASAFGTSYLFHGDYQGTIPTNAYGVYIADVVDNYFAGNIGIGTSSPRGALDVNGAVRLESGAPNGIDISTNGLAFEDNGDTGLFLTNYAGSSTGDLNLYMNNQPVLTIDDTSTDVGIGTTNPDANFHVYSTSGNIGSTGIAGAAITGSGWQGLALDGTASNKSLILHYGGVAGNELRFGRFGDNLGAWESNVVTIDMDAPGNSFVVADDGDVGIGHGLPSYDLHVSGDGYFTDSAGIGMEPNSLYQLAVMNSDKVGVSGLVDYQRAIYATVDPQASLWTQTVHSAAGIVVSARTDSSITASDTLNQLHGIDVQYGADSGTLGMVSSAIGMRIVPYRSAGTTANQYDLFITNPATGGGTLTGTHYSIYQESTSTTNYFAGEVGIGTTIPDAELDVHGSVHVGVDYGNDYLSISPLDSNDYAYISARNTPSSPGTTKLALQTFTSGMSSVGLSVDDIGRVGIGMMDPAMPLDINGTTRITGSANPRLYLSSTNTGSVSPRVIDVSGTDIRVYREGGAEGTLEFLRINSSGDFGIGTSGHLSDLTVAGLGSSGWRVAIYGEGTTSSTYGMVIRPYNSTTNNFWIRDDGAGYLRASAWAYGSDRRLKENINEMNEYGLDTILSLNPHKFDYIEGSKDQIGFIAQDVQSLIPEAVMEDDNGMLGMQTGFLIPILVNAVQEQNSFITTNTNDLTTKADMNSLTDLQTLVGEIPDQVRDDVSAELFISTRTDAEEGETLRDDILLLQTEANTLSDNIEAIETRLDATDAGLAILELLGATELTTLETLLAVDPEKLVYTDEEGNLTIESIITATTIKAQSIETNTLVINDDVTEEDGDGDEVNAASVGDIEIPIGETQIDIDTLAFTEGAKVFVTAVSEMGDNTFHVEKDYENNSFAIILDHALEDVVAEFDWFVVGGVK